MADPTATLGPMTPMPVRRLLCIARHRFPDEFELRPPLIGARVEWLYYARSCRRCGYVDRRWWRVDPRKVQLAGIGKAIPVAKYLKRLKVTPPDPLAITPGPAPEELSR